MLLNNHDFVVGVVQVGLEPGQHAGPLHLLGHAHTYMPGTASGGGQAGAGTAFVAVHEKAIPTAFAGIFDKLLAPSQGKAEWIMRSPVL